MVAAVCAINSSTCSSHSNEQVALRLETLSTFLFPKDKTCSDLFDLLTSLGGADCM